MHEKIEHAGVLRVVASDAFPVGVDGKRLPLPADFVMGIGGASRTLLRLTPTQRVKRALDLGCGSGVQTVFLNADRVVATDIDARALELAAATCHLSGFRRLDDDLWREGDRLIEFRQGSLFEPVAGQRFDLIVSNPPFVIAGAGHTHRDSPLVGDGLTELLCRQVGDHLNPGGVAIVLTTWLGADWQQRISDWLPAGCGAWVALRDELDPATYVEVWGDDAALGSEARASWRERLTAQGIGAIGFGWIVVVRDGEDWRLFDDVRTAPRLPDGAEVLAQIDRARRSPTAVDLLAGRWELVTDHWRGNLALDPFGLAIVRELRAGTTLDAALDRVAATLPVDADDLRIHGLTLVGQLVTKGWLRAVAMRGI